MLCLYVILLFDCAAAGLLTVLHHPAENRRFWPTATTSVREGVNGHLARHVKLHISAESHQIFIISGDFAPKSRTKVE